MMNPRIQAPTFQSALLNTGQERIHRVKPPASSFFSDYPQRMENGKPPFTRYVKARGDPP